MGAPGVGIEGTTDMTAASVAAKTSSTRCAICARPAQSGAHLCVECQAAVKRARHVPNLQAEVLPQTIAGTGSAGRVGADKGRTMPARRATRVGIPPVLGGWGTYATLIAFGAAVSLSGYFATDKQEEESNRERAALAARTASTADTGAGAQLTSSPLAAEVGSPGDDVIAQIEWTVPPASTAGSPGGVPSKKPARDPRSAGNGSMPKAINVPRSVDVPKPAPLGTGESVAASTVAPMTEVQAPPVPDRWQMLATAMSRCESENLLVSFVCKEQARLQYCEGHWGEAPQCPSVAVSNNTR